MLAEIGKIIMRKHTRKCMLTHTQMCTFLDRKSQAHTSPIHKPEPEEQPIPHSRWCSGKDKLTSSKETKRGVGQGPCARGIINIPKYSIQWYARSKWK